MTVRNLVYSLSRKYSPPTIDLRKANILDDYGDESLSPHLINHQVPEDVTINDLNSYSWVYPFLEFLDLVFYLYPIALEFERDENLECIDSFLYSIDRLISSELPALPIEDQQALLDGLKWIWNAAPLGWADWAQCPNLQAAIGISATRDDLK